MAKKSPNEKQQAAHRKVLQNTEKASRIFLLLLLVVFPLIVYDYTNITKVKYISFIFLAFGIFATTVFFLGGLYLDGMRPQKRPFSVERYLPYIALAAFLILGALSNVCSPYRKTVNVMGDPAFWFGSGRYDGYFLLLLYTAVFVIVSRFGSLKDYHFAAISGALIAMSALGICQLHGVNLLTLYPIGSYRGTVIDFVSTLGNEDMMSGFLCISIPLLAGYYMADKRQRWMNILLFVGMGMGLLLMFRLKVSSGKVALIGLVVILLPVLSRNRDRLVRLLRILVLTCTVLAFCSFVVVSGGNTDAYFNFKGLVFFVAALVILALQFLLGKFTRETYSKKLPWILFASEILAVCGVLALIYTLCPYDTEEGANRSLLTEISAFLHGQINDRSGNYRFGIWRHSLDLFAKYPVLGTGAGSYATAMNDIAGAELTAYGIGIVDVAHNEYLQLLCTNGILGLLSYLVFIGSVVGKGFKKIAEDSAVLVLLPAVLGYFIQAFFSFNIVIVTPLLWAILGLLYRVNFLS